MRTKIIAAIGCLGLLVLGGNASAVGYSIVGGNIAVLPGDMFTVTIELDLMGNASTGHSVDVVFCSGCLAVGTATELGAPPYQFNLNPGPTMPDANTVQFEAGNLFGAVAPGTPPFAIGTIQFTAIGGAGTVTSISTTFSTGQAVLDGSGVPLTGVLQDTVNISIVPEPGTLALMALGLGALAYVGRRR